MRKNWALSNNDNPMNFYKTKIYIFGKISTMVIDFEKYKYDDGTMCLCVYFAGFQMKQLMVRVKSEMSLKRFVNVLIDKFNLEQVDSCGFVGYHVLSIGDRPGRILSYYDKDGRELTFSDQGIENHSDLCLFYAPGTSAFYKISDFPHERGTDTPGKDNQEIIIKEKIET